MKCDNIKLCKINILVSTFGTFDNRDLICLPFFFTQQCYVMI